jgi:hypothetical protein
LRSQTGASIPRARLRSQPAERTSSGQDQSETPQRVSGVLASASLWPGAAAVSTCDRMPRDLLDHLVGGGQQCFRDGEAERLGSLEVDDEPHFCNLLHRQVGWPLAL